MRFVDIRLFMYDFDGDGVKEPAVQEYSVGGSWDPSHVDVFMRKGGAWSGYSR